MWPTKDIRTQMFVLREKIDECMDDEDWELFFPKLLRNMAVYLDRDRENFLKAFDAMREELRHMDLLEKMSKEGGYDDED